MAMVSPSARTRLLVAAVAAALALGVTACGDGAQHTTSGSSTVLSTPTRIVTGDSIADCVADAVWRGRHYPAAGLMQREPTYSGAVGRAVIPACGNNNPGSSFVAWAIEGVNPRDAIVRRGQLNELYCRSDAVCRRVVARLRLDR